MARIAQTDVYFNSSTQALQLGHCTGYVFCNAGTELSDQMVADLEAGGISVGANGEFSVKEAPKKTAKKDAAKEDAE